MPKLLFIVLGGGIGALLRYLISGLTYKFTGGSFPWGTLIVNLTGAFIIGFLWELSERIIISANLKLFIFIGVIGAFTTFSTYSMETVNLLRDGEVKLALSNILLSNVLCITLVFAGLIAFRYTVNFLK